MLMAMGRGRVVMGRRARAGVLLAFALAIGSLAPARASAKDAAPNLQTFELPSPLVNTSTSGGKLRARPRGPEGPRAVA